MVFAWWWGAALLALLSGPARAICPSKCTCEDESAACLDAQLEVVPIHFNPNVESINLRGNRISNVHYTLNFYSQLVRFDVSHNKITSLGSQNFLSQSKLVYLNASWNHISSLGKDVFKGLVELQTLDLSHNHIETIHGACLREANNIVHLDLSHNRITSFEETAFLKDAVQIQTILLHSNQILDVPSGVLRHLPGPCRLETLTLSNNLIEVVEENAFPGACSLSLRNLSLGYNVIRDIDPAAFNPLHNLKKLDLSFNNLTSVPTHQLSKLGKLKELDLSGNMYKNITKFAFQTMFDLRTLRLNFLVFLENIHQGAFVDNLHLQRIEIENNPQLTSLPPRMFTRMQQLTHISLKGDSLETVDASHFPVDRLQWLDLSENPLNCNCSLFWLWQLAQRKGNRSEGPSVGRPTCGAPANLRGKPLRDVAESSVRCETTWTTVAVVTALVLALFGATCVALLMFNDRKLCWCRGEKGPPAEPRRLAPAALAVGAPAPILMLVPDKHFPDDLKPWPPDHRNDYPDFGARKQPHVVYV